MNNFSFEGTNVRKVGSIPRIVIVVTATIKHKGARKAIRASVIVVASGVSLQCPGVCIAAERHGFNLLAANNVRCNIVLVGGVVDVGEDSVSVSKGFLAKPAEATERSQSVIISVSPSVSQSVRVLHAPWFKTVAHGVHITITPNARVAKQIPCS